MQLDKKDLQNLIFKYKTRKKDTSTGRINFLLFILGLYFVGNFVFVNCNILKQLKRNIKIIN